MIILNYDKELENLIQSLDHKPTLLLHSCCAPCSSSVIERLMPYFNITVLYYNPNIEPKVEYEKRKEEQKRFLEYFNVNMLDSDYDNFIWHEVVNGLENEPERGKRCYICYKKRLEYTANTARSNNFEYFGTTLTLSPYKNANWINEIGLNLEKEYNIKFLVSDFKKKDGYKRSIELSNKYGLYRQNYCGCEFSKRNSIMDD